MIAKPLLCLALAAFVAESASAAAHAHAPGSPSFGQLGGLHQVGDTIGLKASVALVLDGDTQEVLFSKNSQAVLPIASISKLMTAIVVVEAKQPDDELLTVIDDDVDVVKHSSSRLAVGTQLTRGEMLHLALMASENRAAHALARAYPGGLAACVVAMNKKAAELGMAKTRFIEPTGLSSSNQSSANDLALLVKAAHEVQTIRELSTSEGLLVRIGKRMTRFHSTDILVHNRLWEISLQKTGYITEAGRCLVLQATVAGHQLVMVLLDSAGGRARSDDAERIKRWVTHTYATRALAAVTLD